MNAASPDAELIQMCTRFIEVETLMITTYNGPQCIEDDAERLAATSTTHSAMSGLPTAWRRTC